LLAIFITAIAVYGSLSPFHYRPLEIRQAFEQFGRLHQAPRHPVLRADFLANVLLFIPISYCWLAVFVVDRRWSALTILAVAFVVVLCAALSTALEFAQLWFPPRIPSQNDMIGQTLGSLLGIGLWFAVGQTITDWIRCCTVWRRRPGVIDWLLQAYLIGLVVHRLLPLDLTIRAGDLFHKYRGGMIRLVPFSDMGTGAAFFQELASQVAVFIPVGMLAATWLTSRHRPVRSIFPSVLFGGLIALGIELAQLPVYSRSTSTSEVLTGTLGVWVGAWLMRRWRGRGLEAAPQSPSTRSARRAALWLGVAGVYAAFLVVVYCWPWNPIDDLPELKARYDGFYGVRFSRLAGGEQGRGVWEVSKQIALYAPLGALFAMAVVPLSVPPAIRRILLAALLMVAAGVATSIEIAQVFFPPHVSDLTDVLLCTAGAAIGMFACAGILARRAAAFETRSHAPN
jgi:glycopeptide antibiotics resistance protein